MDTRWYSRIKLDKVARCKIKRVSLNKNPVTIKYIIFHSQWSLMISTTYVSWKYYELDPHTPDGSSSKDNDHGWIAYGKFVPWSRYYSLKYFKFPVGLVLPCSIDSARCIEFRETIEKQVWAVSSLLDHFRVHS